MLPMLYPVLDACEPVLDQAASGIMTTRGRSHAPCYLEHREFHHVGTCPQRDKTRLIFTWSPHGSGHKSRDLVTTFVVKTSTYLYCDQIDTQKC